VYSEATDPAVARTYDTAGAPGGTVAYSWYSSADVAVAVSQGSVDRPVTAR